MIINDAGTYTLKYTATDSCGKTTTVDRELVVKEPIYGIISRSSASNICERIGASADFANPVSQCSDGNGGWVGGSSPFDNIMPWSGMQIVEDAEAGTLVSIPKFYYKWTISGDRNEVMQLEISASPQDGFYTSPAHADRGDGFGERDIIYVGRYHCSDTYKSETGVKPHGSSTRNWCRTKIHDLGTDVWQWDFATYWTIAMLYLVEFADWNSQGTIGYGCSASRAIENNGLTDDMTYHTGTSSTRYAYGHTQYRYIEDLWSNCWTWVDGAYFDSDTYNNLYCIKNPSEFSDNSNGTYVGGAENQNDGYTRTFNAQNIPGFEYALYPFELTLDGANSRTRDNCYNNASTNLCVGGNFSNNQDYGMFYFRTFGNSSINSSYGSRLMKLPSA